MAILDFGALAEASVVLFGIFGLILAFLARDVDRWPKRLSFALLASSIAGGALALLERVVTQYPVSLPVRRAVYISEMLIKPLPTVLVAAYLLYSCGEDPRKSTVMRLLCALTAAGLAAGLIALFTGEIGIAPDNAVQGGLWSTMYFALILAVVPISLIALIRRWERLAKVQRVIFLVCFLTTTSLQLILIELYLMTGLVQRYLAERDEATRQRTRVAVAQMRPHFIYNTLMSVYYLCPQDPPKAQGVIKDFTRYLQKNFNAIATEDTIPFEQELEHTRAYLAVEQACFENHLFVEFDTPNINFRLPPLTLQPIVENAVKHGLTPELEPLYVSVVAQEVAQGVQITVEDTGPGFAPSDDDAPQLTLRNIRQRLKAMCGGTLEIEPREAGGTRVTLFIPRTDEAIERRTK
ncbi:MAG: histidine kinase [Clostridia bacterium]|nr:histidine kinase [Clostridia bacterium]MBQ9039275.1 histidine kinase [Clostridia bacterium]